MNCKRAKLYVALLVGDDLDDSAESELQTHLRECAACRNYHQRMAAAPPPWQDCQERTDFTPHDSLWPGLVGKLASRPGKCAVDFNGWWAAVSVIVACFAIALFWSDEAQSGRWNAAKTAEFVPPNSDSTPAAYGVIPESGPRVPADSSIRPAIAVFDRYGRLRIFVLPGSDARHAPPPMPRLRHSGSTESGGDESLIVPRHGLQP